MRKDNLYAVILAGGQGTRFWPLSRKEKPKQFLNIIGHGSLFQQTIKRLLPKVKRTNFFVVSGRRYAEEIKKQMRPYRIPVDNLLLEPEGKNTAPSICWAAAKIFAINTQAVMAVFPSDHLIVKEKIFHKVLDHAFNWANEQKCLMTLGLVPTRPATGYGYLDTTLLKNPGKKSRQQEIYKVRKFVEKPTLSLARKHIRKKNYFWNSGMFVWRADVILEAFRRYLPKVYNLIGREAKTSCSRASWRKLPSISIDYGIMEKAGNVMAVKAADIGWTDLGSWDALKDVLKADKDGNIFKGPSKALETKNSLVWSDKKFVAAIGLDNLIVIDTPDALLICRKDLSEKVKDIALTEGMK